MMPEDKNDLTEGWPADADNEELARFTRELQEGRPQLSETALGRVEERIQGALTRGERHRRWSWMSVAVAASLLMAVSLSYFAMREVPHGNVATQGPAPVEDRISVRFVEPGAAVAPGGALLRLDENQSLFAQ